jgi:hypothetical protein
MSKDGMSSSGAYEDVTKMEEVNSKIERGSFNREIKFKEIFSRSDSLLQLSDEQEVCNGEIKEVDSDLYYKTYVKEKEPFYTSFSELQSMIYGKWVKFSSSLEEDISAHKIDYGDLSSALSIAALLDSSFYRRENSQAIKDLLTKKDGYIIKRSLADDVVEGVETFHYEVSFSPDLLKGLSIEFAKLNMISSEEEADRFSEDRVRQNFDAVFGKDINVPGEIWIGKNDGLIYRVKGEVEIEDNDFYDLFDQEEPKGLEDYAISYRESQKGSKKIIKGDITYFDFNKPVDNIVAPSDFISIEDAIQELVDSKRN